jgi:hypothetical protein
MSLCLLPKLKEALPTPFERANHPFVTGGPIPICVGAFSEVNNKTVDNLVAMIDKLAGKTITFPGSKEFILWSHGHHFKSHSYVHESKRPSVTNLNVSI